MANAGDNPHIPHFHPGGGTPSIVKIEGTYKGPVGMNVCMHLIRRIAALFKRIRELWGNVRSFEK